MAALADDGVEVGTMVPAYVGVAFGLALVAAGLWLRRRDMRLLRIGERARGRYVGAATEPSALGAHASSRYGVVEFTTRDGQTIRVRGRLGVPWAGRWVGREVGVIYDPEAPHRALLDTFVETYGAALIFLLTGALMTVACLVAIVVL